MQPHQQRVVDDCLALGDKIKTLHNFFVTKTFKSLDVDDQNLLTMQYYAMMVYVGILQKRIAKF